MIHSAVTRHLTAAQTTSLREHCAEEFARVAQSLAEVRVLTLCTADGRALASRFALRGDADRVAAMSSALQALCETVARELNAGRCRHVVVAAERLHLVVVRIAHARGQYALALGAADGVLLAVALRAALDLAERIGRQLSTLR